MPIEVPVEITVKAAEATGGGIGMGELAVVLMGIAVVALGIWAFAFNGRHASKEYTDTSLKTYDFRDNANDRLAEVRREIDGLKRGQT